MSVFRAPVRTLGQPGSTVAEASGLRLASVTLLGDILMLPAMGTISVAENQERAESQSVLLFLFFLCWDKRLKCTYNQNTFE